MSEYAKITEPGAMRLERVLPGPIERVWEYLTDADKRGKWLARGPMELRVGGRVELQFHNANLSRADDPPPEKYKQYAEGAAMSGRVTRCDPPRLLSYTWEEPNSPDSEVTFELSPRGKDVFLVLTHRRLGDDPATLIGVLSGWHAHVGILIDILSDRKPASFWSTHTRLETEYEKRVDLG